MVNSVLNVNGTQLKEKYSKSESDLLITTLLKKSSAHCVELGVGIYDLYLPHTTTHKSPNDAIFDFVQIIKAHYPLRRISFIWKKDTIPFGKRYRTRYRVAVALEQHGFNDYENVLKYVLKSWSELHGFKLKDAFRTRNLLASVESHDYCIERRGDTPVEVTIGHVISYFDPTVEPRIL